MGKVTGCLGEVSGVVLLMASALFTFAAAMALAGAVMEGQPGDLVWAATCVPLAVVLCAAGARLRRTWRKTFGGALLVAAFVGVQSTIMLVSTPPMARRGAPLWSLAGVGCVAALGITFLILHWQRHEP